MEDGEVCASSPIVVTEASSGMDTAELAPAGLKLIPERYVSPREVKYLAQVDVDPAALEERWGGPETNGDDVTEWFAFVFSPVEGEAFTPLRQVENPPAPGSSGPWTLPVRESLT